MIASGAGATVPGRPRIATCAGGERASQLEVPCGAGALQANNGSRRPQSCAGPRPTTKCARTSTANSPSSATFWRTLIATHQQMQGALLERATRRARSPLATRSSALAHGSGQALREARNLDSAAVRRLAERAPPNGEIAARDTDVRKREQPSKLTPAERPSEGREAVALALKTRAGLISVDVVRHPAGDLGPNPVAVYFITHRGPERR